MGIYGNLWKTFLTLLKKFKRFFQITQYIVYKINYIHTYGYRFEKSVVQKNNESFTKN